MRKSLEIRDERTILKFDALQVALNMSAPQIIDRALDTLIISMNERKKKDSIIRTFITESPLAKNVSVITKRYEVEVQE
mgnify:CR=1 FL=1